MNSDESIEMVPPNEHDPRIQAALAELRELIARRFTDASFEIVRRDDPDGIYLIATVDVDDLDEVTDTISSRIVDMQVDERLPVYVVPDWPLERIREQLRQLARDRATIETVVPTPTAVG